MCVLYKEAAEVVAVEPRGPRPKAPGNAQRMDALAHTLYKKLLVSQAKADSKPDLRNPKAPASHAPA